MTFIIENWDSLLIVWALMWLVLIFLNLLTLKNFILNPSLILQSFITQTEVKTVLQYLRYGLTYNQASNLLQLRNPNLTLGDIDLLLLGRKNGY